jgi:hypothetical protein
LILVSKFNLDLDNFCFSSVFEKADPKVRTYSGVDETFYKSRTIMKITWPGEVCTTPWLQGNAPWFAWLIPAVVNGRAVMTSEDASVGVSVPQ